MNVAYLEFALILHNLSSVPVQKTFAMVNSLEVSKPVWRPSLAAAASNPKAAKFEIHSVLRPLGLQNIPRKGLGEASARPCSV